MDYLIEFLQTLNQDDENVQALTKFHRANLSFMVALVSEIQLLRDAGWKAAGVSAIFHFLRWEPPTWCRTGQFLVDQNLAPYYVRLATIFWPEIVNGTVQLRRRKTQRLDADALFGTRIEPAPKRKRKGYTRRLECADGRPIEELRFPTLPLPQIPRQPVPPAPTEQQLITWKRLNTERNVIEAVREVIAHAPDPNHPKLRAALRLTEQFPEIADFMTGVMLTRNSEEFSVGSIWHYARWKLLKSGRTVRHQNDALNALYCRLTVILHPEFNGRAEFQERSDANALLGLRIAKEKRPGDYAKRLLWADGTELESWQPVTRHVPVGTKVKPKVRCMRTPKPMKSVKSKSMKGRHVTKR